MHTVEDALPVDFPTLFAELHPVEDGRKPYITKTVALLSAHCEDCLLLDADNMAARDPTFLFSSEEFKQASMLLWPDYWSVQ